MALLISLALASLGQAKEAQPQQVSLASKLTAQSQPKARSARSLSDMFEKVKSKIFGSRKQQPVAQASVANSQVAPASSAISSAAQRQPWIDVSVSPKPSAEPLSPPLQIALELS